MTNKYDDVTVAQFNGANIWCVTKDGKVAEAVGIELSTTVEVFPKVHEDGTIEYIKGKRATAGVLTFKDSVPKFIIQSTYPSPKFSLVINTNENKIIAYSNVVLVSDYLTYDVSNNGVQVSVSFVVTNPY